MLRVLARHPRVEYLTVLPPVCQGEDADFEAEVKPEGRRKVRQRVDVTDARARRGVLAYTR